MTKEKYLQLKYNHDYNWSCAKQWKFYCKKCNNTFAWHVIYRDYIRLPTEFKNDFISCNEWVIKNLLE